MTWQTVGAVVQVAPDTLRDGNLDVTPIIFTNLMGQLTRELDKSGYELAGPVTFHKGVRDDLRFTIEFRAEAPARPYGSRDRYPTPGIERVPGGGYRHTGEESRSYVGSTQGDWLTNAANAYNTNGFSIGAEKHLPNPPPYRWQSVGGTWYERDINGTRIVPPPPVNPISKDKPVVTPKEKEGMFTVRTVQTKAGIVGQVTTADPTDGELLIVWESEPFTGKRARESAKTAGNIALGKHLSGAFDGLSVSADEVTALLPDEKTAA